MQYNKKALSLYLIRWWYYCVFV